MLKRLALKYIRTKFKILSTISKRKAAENAFELFTTPQRRNKRVPPPVFHKAEQLNFSFNEIKIRGFRWNKGAAKKLLILHGYESSVVNFDQFINPLIKKDYEILAFDAPAHGRSSGKKLNVLNYKNFVLHIYHEFGPIHSFITHSFGGLALSLALEEIPHDQNMKVVFIAPATESTTAINRFFDIIKLDEEVRKEFDQFITNANNKSPEWYSVSRAAENIKAQVLFLQDKDDKDTPLSDVETLIQKKYQNFRFIITEGLGHRRIYREPGSVQAIIDFL